MSYIPMAMVGILVPAPSVPESSGLLREIYVPSPISNQPFSGVGAPDSAFSFFFTNIPLILNDTDVQGIGP